MLCEQCKQREATIVLTEVVNGKRTEHNLCRFCASRLERAQFLDTDFPFMKILSDILGLQTDAENLHFEQLEQLACPVCGTTYGDFVKNSSFGCGDCYDTFGLLIENNIRKMQGSNVHVGKHPKFHVKSSEQNGLKNQDSVTQTSLATGDVASRNTAKPSLEEQIKLLKARLKEALDEEEYENAAKYRDEIKQLTALAEEGQNHE
ncbi:MAG: UvrB/UvrC motif-containing protein [Lachnospiraceae bacterium]